jgi:hypothetical protein
MCQHFPIARSPSESTDATATVTYAVDGFVGVGEAVHQREDIGYSLSRQEGLHEDRNGTRRLFVNLDKAEVGRCRWKRSTFPEFNEFSTKFNH